MNNKRKAIPMAVPVIGGAQQQQIPFDISQAQPKGCQSCGGGVFDAVYRLGIISAIAPGNKTGQPVTIKTETYLCHTCGLEFGKQPETKQ